MGLRERTELSMKKTVFAACLALSGILMAVLSLGLPRSTQAEGKKTDPGCKGCANSAAVVKWTSQCQNSVSQAACYCAAAALIKCNIDHGGCGSDLATLRKMLAENKSNASQLGTSCF